MAEQKKSNDDNIIESEVNKLFHKSNGDISNSDFIKLKQKYNNIELVDKIKEAYLERHRYIHKKAKKLAVLTREKYSNPNYPFHLILEKAKILKKKYNMSNDEYIEFQRIYETELVSLKSSEVVVPPTNMMKVLGSIFVDFQGFTYNMNDKEYTYLQEILKLHTTQKSLHAAVFAQSIEYTDCDPQALVGKFDRNMGHQPWDSVHPVVAAMFLPKVDQLENHFLRSNIAAIVDARYNNKPVMYRHDFEVFDALTRDPNDVICENKSSIADLLNRAQIQHQLWNNVLHLRNGQYYSPTSNNLIINIDACRLNKFDSPNIMYGRNDGIILKRLLSVFSFRPTVITTMSLINNAVVNPYQQAIVSPVYSVPMINLRLDTSLDKNTPVKLNDALGQYQFIIERGVLVPKYTRIIYSKGVIFFYVERKSHLIRIADMQPFNINRLPKAVAGYDKLNDQPIDFDYAIVINGDEYKLRSVVVAQLNSNIPQSKMITGSAALIMQHQDMSAGRFNNEFFMYNPLRVMGFDPTTGQYYNKPPLAQIQGTNATNPANTFYYMARHQGIIFMYQMVKDTSDGQIYI